MLRSIKAALCFAFLFSFAFTQQPEAAITDTMSFEDYEPISTLVVPENPVQSARFPFIDVHSHQWNMPEQDLQQLARQMDSLNMAVMVNLSGRGFVRKMGPDGKPRYVFRDRGFLKNSIKAAEKAIPGRVIVFTNIAITGIDKPDWQERTLRELEEDVANGAKGLKIYKSLGLTDVDSKGNRIAVDDPRIDPIWQRCGELGIPVLIHSGEPANFWKPKNKYNERWLELKQKPERYRNPKLVPPFEQVMGEQQNVFRKHPKTTFINAHLGWMGNDLAGLGKQLDEFPNVYTEIGAVLAELGRQPRFAKQWFIKYQDRVMFGKDLFRPKEFFYYFRTLETADEYFPYYRKRHAFWRLYGMDLPDDVLKKLYYKNALKVIPGIDSSRFPE
ncbi:MAG: amidohydrolase family protein [Calditrichia bacterium]